MTISEILAAKKPESIFSADPDEAKKQFRDLAKKFHPDTNKEPNAEEAFKVVNIFYKEALAKFLAGTWDRDGKFQAKSKWGFPIQIDYLKRHNFELGEFFIGHDHVTYLIDATHKELFENGIRVIRSLPSSMKTPAIQAEIGKCLPTINSKITAKPSETFELVDGRLGVSIYKSPDMLLLRDVLNFYVEIDPRHTAWILNTLYNIGCYLSYASRLSHHDISPDTFFISPKDHGGALLGGWWYAKPIGHPVKQVPKRTYKILPWEVRSKKIALPNTDLDLIRATGKELSSKNPKPMANWFKEVSAGGAVEDYKAWGKILEKSFGPRRFQVMDLDAEKMYKMYKMYKM